MKGKIALLSLVCAVWMLAAPPVHGEPIDMKDISKKTNHVFRRVMDNGLTVVLREDHRAPVVSLEMWVETGSVYEQEYAGTGISHFVEHMLFKGTEKRGVGQIAQEIQSYGGDINAHTSYENTVYTINVESSKFPQALEILSDSVMHSSFDPEEFRKEKEVILKEINMNDDDPERYLAKLFWSTAYTKHPAKDPVIGYEQLFRAVTREDLVRYYKTRYVPNNMVLVAVGDFSAKEAYAEIEKLFASFPRGIWTTPLLPSEPAQLGPRRTVDHRDLGQAYALVGFHGPSISDPDMTAMDVLSIILGEGRSSRLYQEAREKRGLVNSISSWSYTPTFPGVFGVSASLAPEKLEPLLALVWEQLERLKKEPVTAEELEKAKAQTIGEYYFSLETMSGQSSDLGSSEVMAHNATFSQEYMEKVARVTADDIRRVAAKYFRKDLQNEVFLLPKGAKAPEEQAVAAGKKETQIHSHVLKNGVRVLIKQDSSLPTVTVKALFKGGLLCETSKDNGISSIFSEMLIQGTKKRTAEEIVSQLELSGGNISNYSGSNSFGFSVDVLSQNWKLAVDLLCEIVMEPAFPEQPFQREKQAALLEIQALEDQIFQTTSKLFREAMFEGHPYRFVSLGTKESVSGLRREDLLRFYKDYVVGTNVVVAVFGDVNEAEVLKELEKGLAGLPDRKAPFPKPSGPSIQKPKKVSKVQDGKQAVIMLGYPGVDIYNPDRFVFEVMDGLFSGLGSRLFGAIRESHGLAYLVGSYQITGLDPGAFVFYVGTVPDSVDFVVAELFKEIGKIKTAGVDPVELERAKRGLIGGRKIHLQTNAQLAFQSGLDELYGLGWKEYQKYYDHIQSVTVEDVRRVANKYFADDRYVLCVVHPPAAAPKAEQKAGKKGVAVRS